MAAEAHTEGMRQFAEEILKTWTEFVDEETAEMAHDLADRLKTFANRVDPR